MYVPVCTHLSREHTHSSHFARAFGALLLQAAMVAPQLLLTAASQQENKNSSECGDEKSDTWHRTFESTAPQQWTSSPPSKRTW